MDKMHIYPTDESPEIIFDPTAGTIELKGKSLPEDIKSFYNPLENAIINYLKNPKEKTVINMRFDYLNSASTKRLLEIITRLEQSFKNGLKVDINWYYKEHDEEMQEEGEEFGRLTYIPVKLFCVKE
jgi:hypothetical protein